MAEPTKGKGGLAALILGGPGPDGAEDGGDDDSAYEAGLDAASDEMIKALHTHDAEGFKQALHSFVEQCLAHHKDAEPDADDYGDDGEA